MWTNAARASSSVTVATSCGNCGRPVDRAARTLWRPAMCAECKRAKQIELDRNRRRRNKPKEPAFRELLRAGEGIEIVYDPDPVAGFAAGARLNCYSEMLALGSFTPGTILKRYCRRYRVVGEAGKRQEVELVK